MEPGERIKELRIEKGFGKNQKGFADALGFSDGYLSEIETGKKNPSPEILLAIEQKFGVSAGFILYGLSDNLWRGILDVFQSADPPEELLQKLRPLISSYSQDHPHLAWSDVHPPYGNEAQQTERRLPQNKSIRALVNKVIGILSSGNQKVIKALVSNVEVFFDSIKAKNPEIKEGD